MGKLENAILITGAGQRIGYYLVKQLLLQTDYPVVFTYRSHRPQVDELAALGAIPIHADFTKTSELPGLVAKIQTQVVSLRAVIHNASLWLPDALVPDFNAFPAADLTVLQSVFQLHVETPYYLNTALVPLLNASDSQLKDIISISDFSVDRVSAGHIAYLASKSALQTLSKGFAQKLAPQIKVNDIAPALIMFNEGDSDDYKNKRLAQSALGIEPGAEVVWQAVRYLMDSPYTTGTILHLEGGRSLM